MDAFKNLSGRVFGEQQPKNGEDKSKNKINPEKIEENKLLNNTASVVKNDQSFLDDFSDAFKNIGDKIETRVDNAADEIGKGFNQLQDSLQSFLKQYRFSINKWARQKTSEFALVLFEKLRPIAKQAIKDPDMCQCVKNLVDDIVDDVWPDVVDEVKYQLLMKVQDPYLKVPQSKVLVICYPCYYMRNWYLYTVQPFDRSIWKQFKTMLSNTFHYDNSSWWFWTLVASVPFYGVSQFFYVFHFFMIDKQDEFQLVQFILGFKTMYFVTQGIQKAIIGYFILYSCSTMINQHSKIDATRCIRYGPGASIQEMAEVIGFFVQIFFIWLAFFLLPCSEQKGRPNFTYDDDKPTETGCCPRGGRLKYFMLYDFIALSASCGLFLLVFFHSNGQNRPFNESGDYIFFTEVCYGLLSLPFILFKIPVLSGRLTKAKPTAYDKFGHCVPKIQDLKVIQEEKKKGLLDTMEIEVGEVFQS